MQHIEEAGVPSGDSSCVLPAHQLSPASREIIRRYTVALGRALNVVGLMNIQFAVQGDNVFVIEVNPRASRASRRILPISSIGLLSQKSHCLTSGFNHTPKTKICAAK